MGAVPGFSSHVTATRATVQIISDDLDPITARNQWCRSTANSFAARRPTRTRAVAKRTAPEQWLCV